VTASNSRLTTEGIPLSLDTTKSSSPLTTARIQSSLETKAVSPEVDENAMSLRFYRNMHGNKLNLSGRKLESKDVDAVIAMLQHFPQITEVDLSDNNLGAQGAKDFARKNRSAKTVDLSENGLGDQGAKDFAEANEFATTVRLCFNGIGAKGAKDFAVANRYATTVNLSFNEIKAQGAKDFAVWNSRSKVATTVNLSFCKLGAQGAEAFAMENKVADTVNLSNNEIGAQGALGFEKANTVATTVSLRHNEIGDVGAEALKKSRLFIDLDVSYNSISPQKEAELAKQVAENRARYYGWMEVSLMVAAFRANQKSEIADGCVPLIPIIMQEFIEGDAPKKKDLFSYTKKSAPYFMRLVREPLPKEKKGPLPEENKGLKKASFLSCIFGKT